VSQPVSDDAADLFERELPLIEGVIRFVVRRHRLAPDEAEDFASDARLRLIEHDYRILRTFRGRSSLRTFLGTVIERLLLDHRTARWGKWRPSAEARRAGSIGVRLDALLHRDGLPLDQAIEVLLAAERGTVTRGELERLGARLPRRARRVFVGEDALSDVAAADDQGAPAGQHDELAALSERIHARLVVALDRLAPQQRLICKLRFEDELTIAEVARGLGLDQKRLYRDVDRIKATLRAWLEADGVSAEDIRAVLGRLAE
jgi:RNA polymerase sigma factor for flagellar operon FliA